MNHFTSREEGQGLTEYGWLIVLAVILVLVVVAALGAGVLGLWEKIVEAWDNVWQETSEPSSLVPTLSPGMTCQEMAPGAYQTALASPTQAAWAVAA